MKYFIVSDVHGFYREFMQALGDAGFSKNAEDHTLVVLGDLLDRGPNAYKCLEFVNNVPRKILIRGNHEDLLEAVLARKEFKNHDLSNGTADTVFQLCGSVKDPKDVFNAAANNPELIKYLDAVVDGAELKNSIFVHGWIPCQRTQSGHIYTPDWREAADTQWNTARWLNGMECWNDGVREPGKTIYCGHWHTSWGHSKLHNIGVEFPNMRSTNPQHRIADFSPFIDDGIVAIDACTAFSHKVNCFVIEDEPCDPES